MSFTVKELEEKLNQLNTDENATGLLTPMVNHVWDNFPIDLKEVGDEKRVYLEEFERHGGSEGDGEYMHVVITTGWGSTKRYFKKTGFYSSWDDSTWDGELEEVYPIKVERTDWTTTKPEETNGQ